MMMSCGTSLLEFLLSAVQFTKTMLLYPYMGIQCNSSSNRSPYRIQCNSSSNRSLGYSVIVALTGLPIGYSVIVALTGL